MGKLNKNTLNGCQLNVGPASNIELTSAQNLVFSRAASCRTSLPCASALRVRGGVVTKCRGGGG